MNSSHSQYVWVQAPEFSRQHIIELAENLGRKFVDSINLEPSLFAINFELVYEYVIYPDYEIVLIEDQDLGYDEDGTKILGEYIPCTNTAYIDVSLGRNSNDPRRTFTCWHEVGGHGVLQGDWLRKKLQALQQNACVITTDKSIELTTTIDLEVQANLFAAHAAAPTWLLNHVIRDVYALDVNRYIPYRGPGRYSLDVHGRTRYYDIPDFLTLCRVVGSHIKYRFGRLSIEALSYRVAESSLVIDEVSAFFRLRRTARPSRPTISSDFSKQQILAEVGS